MNFQLKEYLSNAEERIVHLRKIIDGRPVAILTPGSSVRELEERIEELRHVDICYFGVNSYTVQETSILHKIDKQFSVVQCSAREGMTTIMPDILSFLDRGEDNMLVSSFWRDTFAGVPTGFDLQQFFTKYNEKFIFFSLDFRTIFPNEKYPLHFIVSNSLLVLLQIAIIGMPSSIVLFGADGGFVKGDEDWYYRQDDVGHRGSPDGKLMISPRKNVLNDTVKYFNPIVATALKNLYNTYGITPIEILNCSEDSFYTTFPKVSYDIAFKHLLGRS